MEEAGLAGHMLDLEVDHAVVDHLARQGKMVVVHMLVHVTDKIAGEVQAVDKIGTIVGPEEEIAAIAAAVHN